VPAPRSHNQFHRIIPPKECPSCGRQQTLVPFLANEREPAFLRLSVMTEGEARDGKTLYGGTSFALRVFACTYCSHAMWFYDEAATYDEATAPGEPVTRGAPPPALASPSTTIASPPPTIAKPSIERARRLLANIVDFAADQNAVYQVSLSNGEIIQGLLSPLDEHSDHIRVNPTERGAFSFFVALEHIVYIHRIINAVVKPP
jgi:hypothetical protein